MTKELAAANPTKINKLIVIMVFFCNTKIGKVFEFQNNGREKFLSTWIFWRFVIAAVYLH
jgi:hypothetical protein